MSVPAKRRSSSEARRGRSHQALKPNTLAKCSKCGKAILPHQVCKFCGFYKGREVIKIKVKSKK
ncbi:50S ribosomal protein L32 [Patescibacteria group bacterium]|nr:50S ribosomal protein L32 [Patescibacteria group bacterium]MBU0879951.1 50S ribosomal protein L32 [Patescibacteria group bacterium]MBU0897859.1 50S ribosomal protein L32 [Patescibacteria group bacterium]MBU1783689.1 50S ribosomal protein L32 [Patescibacteria group bacterium]